MSLWPDFMQGYANWIMGFILFLSISIPFVAIPNHRTSVKFFDVIAYFLVSTHFAVSCVVQILSGEHVFYSIVFGIGSVSFLVSGIFTLIKWIKKDWWPDEYGAVYSTAPWAKK